MTKIYVTYVDFYDNRLSSMLLGWFYLEELTSRERTRYEAEKERNAIHVKKMYVIFGIDNPGESWNIFTGVLSDWSISRADIFETEAQARTALWSQLNPNSKHLIKHIFEL